MKEKLTLLIALSFVVGLTVYKNSLTDDLKLDENVSLESIQIIDDTDNNPNITDGVDNSNDKINTAECNNADLNTDKLQFSEAFKYHRNCAHDTFTWNGIEYTTILKSETNQNTEEKHESMNNIDLVIK
tara:strand:+ start:256 stop:642 length:387 start_codon:yes stop_codon:yes gene_type:complete